MRTTYRGLTLAPSGVTPARGRIGMRRLFVGFVVLAIAFACSDTSAPVATPVPASQLHIVAQGASAPPLYADSVSFYAVWGQDREVRMYYQGATPGDTSAPLGPGPTRRRNSRCRRTRSE